MTYPRIDSKYLTDDMVDKIPNLVVNVQQAFVIEADKPNRSKYDASYQFSEGHRPPCLTLGWKQYSGKYSDEIMKNDDAKSLPDLTQGEVLAINKAVLKEG